MADAAQGDIQALLDEGLRLYGAGQPARALELWYRILDLEPRHPLALEYVQYVRDNFHVDVREPSPGVPAAPAPAAIAEPIELTEPAEPAPPVEVAPPAEAPPPVVKAAVVDAPEGAVDLMPAPTLARPSAAPKAAPVEPVGAGWGELAASDLDLDPLTGRPVQRAPSVEVRRAREENAANAVGAEVSDVEVAEAPPEIPVLIMAPLPVALAPESPPTSTAAADAPLSAPALDAAPPPVDASSPWDGHSGITEAVDLDAPTDAASPMDVLLAGPVRRPHVENGLRGATGDDPAASRAPRERPAEPQSELESLMEGARDLFELGDFSGSLELVEKVLRQDPENAEAHAYLSRNESTLLKMYESKLGDLTTRPRVLTSPDEVIWMNLHHRAGFVLSQVDGELSYEDIAAISGMSRFETFRILAELVQNGVIA